MKYKNLNIILLIFLLIAILIKYIDLPIAVYVNNHITKSTEEFFCYVTRFAEEKILITISILLYFYQYIIKKETVYNLSYKFFIHLQLMLISCFSIQLLKFIIGRYRFSEYIKYHDYGFLPLSHIGYSNSSLPSGHSAAIFSFVTIAILLFLEQENTKNLKIKIYAYSFASFVAFSRIMLNAHYVSDVILGSILGIVIPYLTIKYYINKTSFKEYIA